METEETLEYEIEHDGDDARVILTGGVDLGTLDDLRAAIREAATDGTTCIRLDFRAVDFIDSTGLSSVLGFHNDASRNGYELSVIADDGPVRRAFELTGLAHVLAV